MSQTLSAAERIEIERACARIVYAYSRALDLGNMSAAADFFAEHGSFARPMAPDKVIQGREAIRSACIRRPRLLRRDRGSLRTRGRRVENLRAARLDPDEILRCDGSGLNIPDAPDVRL
jgi:hypothetical protein